MVILARDESAYSNCAFSTWPVLDYNRLSPFSGKPIGKYSSRSIVGTSRRERDDQLYGTLRPARMSGHGKSKN
jgi:hypothetical protein